tara:strand:- start:64 stop:519 length:456 start_codon:yes stop_codon:yes gene_type:complete
MSQLQVNEIRNLNADGCPTLPLGVVVTGVSTAGSFNATGGINITGVATFSGDVSVGGTLTYEDVTNVESTGIVTAGLGLRATSGGVMAVGVYTGFEASGIATFVDVSVGSALTAVAIDGTGSVSVGSTNLLTEINTKATTGKAIAMAMIFG